LSLVVSRSRLVGALAAVSATAAVAATLGVLVHRAGAAGRPRDAEAPPGAGPASTRAATPPLGATTAASTTTTTLTSTTAAPPPGILPPPTAPPTPATTATIDPGHPYAVGTVTLALFDPTRSTPPAGSAPGGPGRSLPTIVRYPVAGAPGGGDLAGAAPSHGGGPYPLVVFAHGFDSSPAAYADLLRAWASAGYVVAAPAFPRGLQGGPLDENDVANEPGDITFVISRLVAADSTPGLLDGLINTAHIGVAGHSDGGIAALGVGFNACCRDPRVSADILGSANEQTFPPGSYFPVGSPPMLVIQGDRDPINPPAYSQQIFAGGRTPKYLLWLLDAGHIEPFSTDRPHLAVVEAVTIAFFDRYLKAQPDGLSRMRAGATPGLATLTAG
jgi:hypothetical protein